MQNKHKYPCNSQYTEIIFILIIISRNLLDFFMFLFVPSHQRPVHILYLLHIFSFTHRKLHISNTQQCV